MKFFNNFTMVLVAFFVATSLSFATQENEQSEAQFRRLHAQFKARGVQGSCHQLIEMEAMLTKLPNQLSDCCKVNQIRKVFEPIRMALQLACQEESPPIFKMIENTFKSQNSPFGGPK